MTFSTRGKRSIHWTTGPCYALTSTEAKDYFLAMWLDTPDHQNIMQKNAAISWIYVYPLPDYLITTIWIFGVAARGTYLSHFGTNVKKHILSSIAIQHQEANGNATSLLPRSKWRPVRAHVVEYIVIANWLVSIKALNDLLH